MRFKDDIMVQTRQFKDSTERLCNEWDDDIGKRFAVRYVEPVIESGVHYARSVDELIKHLDRALIQLRQLAGMSTYYNPGSQHERGDRSGGTTPKQGNTIDLSDFWNNNHQR